MWQIFIIDLLCARFYTRRIGKKDFQPQESVCKQVWIFEAAVYSDEKEIYNIGAQGNRR